MTLDQNDTRLVYVTGNGRSGSTLLDMILGAHPLATSLGEISNFDRYVRSNAACTCGEPMRACAFWSSFLDQLCETIDSSYEDLYKDFPTDFRRPQNDRLHNRARHFLSIVASIALPPNALAKTIPNIAPNLYQKARNVLMLYDLIGRVSEKPFVIDSSKSPHRMKILYAMRPEATKIIYLTRDGRGTIWSYMQRGGYSGAGVEEATRTWVRGNRYALFNLKTLPPSSWIHIRYEQLCREPRETLERVCNFLGLAFDAKMLCFRATHHHNIQGNSMRLESEDRITEDLKWRNSLSKKDLAIFEHIAGSLNRKLLGQYFVE